jgi:hypothetical protein
MSSSRVHQRLPVEKRRRFAVAPTTRLGKWAVGLAAASFVLGMGWRLMGPVGGFPMIVVALAGGVVALRAVFQDGERALTVFASLLWFLMAVALLVELLIALVSTLA